MVGLPEVSSTVASFNRTIKQQVWTSPAGVLKRKNYANSESMSWIIAPTAATSITLTFDDFTTELNFDIVTVKDCTAFDCLQSSLRGTYSGSTIPSQITSNTGVLWIVWKSDDNSKFSGWSARWNSVIGGMVYYDNPLF